MTSSDVTWLHVSDAALPPSTSYDALGDAAIPRHDSGDFVKRRTLPDRVYMAVVSRHRPNSIMCGHHLHAHHWTCPVRLRPLISLQYVHHLP